MAEGNDPVMAEAMSLLEAEPDTKSHSLTDSLSLRGPDIPALHEELTILVSTSKAKEAMQLTQEQVTRLEAKDVEKYYKRYETYVGAKTTETFVDSFLSLYTRAVGTFVPIKDVEALQNDLKKDYVITKELSTLVGSLALRCGRLLMVANTVLITTKHIDFSSPERRHPSRNADGYPLDGIDEAPGCKVVEQKSC